MIQFQTFGAVDLRRDGTEVRSVLSQPKRLALLAWLATATPRGFHSRDRLLALFWPEADDERARNALRQSLHYLRRSLGESAIVGRGDREVGLDEARVRCDAADFDDALAAGRPAEALELYRGDFLAGLHVEDSPDLEQWIDAQRSRYQRAAVTAALAAAEVEDRQGDVRAAALLARRALGIDPHDEASLRRLLELLERAGDRGAAIRAYDEFARRFEAELGIAPSAATRAVIERIRESARPAETPAGPGAASEPVAAVGAGRTVRESQPVAGGTGRTVSESPPVAAVGAVPAAAGSADRRRGTRRQGDRVAGPPQPARPSGWLRHTPARRTAAIAAMGLLVAAGVTGARLVSRSRGVPAPIASPQPLAIAVLPFANMTGDEAHELFSDGIAEELMTALARVPGLQVVARTSAFSFKDRAVGVDSIARALRVAHVLEGSVRITGRRLRVTAKLVDAASGYQVWADAYEGELTDALEVQDAITRSIVTALEPRLGGEHGRAIGRETHDADAHADVLRAFAALRLDAVEAYARADTFFRRALARDSLYARAYAGLARVRAVDAYRRPGPQRQAYAEAKALAERALALDPRVEGGHAVLGRVAEFGDWDFAAAERHYRRALEVAPSDVLALAYLSRLLMRVGRFDEASRVAERLVELDPLATVSHRALGGALLAGGRYERAIDAFRGALALAPDNAFANASMSLALSELGRHDEAVAAAELAIARDPDEELSLAAAGWVMARAGRTAQARELLARIDAAPQPSSYARAMILAGLGETDRAFELLDRAVADRESFVLHLRTMPPFTRMGDVPRMQALLRRIGLAG